MVLSIQTFDNRMGGGSAFFKAAGHPLCLPAAQQITNAIHSAKCPTAYDPHNTLAAFLSIHPIKDGALRAVFVQDVTRVGESILSMKALPITELPTNTDLLFIPIFDSRHIVGQIRRIIPDNCRIVTLDDMRLPEKFLADTRYYLNPINFATNLLFFRDEPNAHTRLVTANYWGAYGAKEPFVWGRLFAGDGSVLTDFEKPLGVANETFILDSVAIRREFCLPDFCGQVFLHVARAAGHDIVKYVVDTYGDFNDDNAATELSCTHDANSWPADLYAGIPAPDKDDTVTLWVQNSHPTPISAGSIGANIMGNDTITAIPEEIAPFATHPIDLGKLLPDACWPQQLEIHAGKHFVRPRYEVVNRTGRRRINHANVERTDLENDTILPTLNRWLGKGYILPAPILPSPRYRSECLPTPMSTAQQNLPLLAVVYDSNGNEINQQFLGCLPRNHQSLLDITALAALGENEIGHVELCYDFSDGGDADGWMHALFRYTDIHSGHMAETSFGAHMFNHLLTYKNEPQSYKGPPPGLSTRLFLRIAPPPVRSFCHLIYPVGVEWNPLSNTLLELKDCHGNAVAEHNVAIHAGGSLAFCCQDIFDTSTLQQAGNGAYVIIRDTSCRLFGYHGSQHGNAFAFDHMFGF